MGEEIKDKLTKWHKLTPEDGTLVIVSKEQPLERVQIAYEAGHRHFGENKAQALAERYDQLPKDIHWHMIGHLQRNKVRYIAPFVHLIQSVDSLRLLEQLEVEGKKQNRLLHCLLQLHIATKEPHKHGLRHEELATILQTDCLDKLHHVQIDGLMGMGTNSDDKDLIISEFRTLKMRFESISKEITHLRLNMKTLSLGMSRDYVEAMAFGSNMFRIGSDILGARPSLKKT